MSNVGSKKRRATNVADQLRVARLQELNDRPDSNVLEGGVGAGQEAVQVVVHSSLRLVPYFVESGVVIGSRSPVLGREVSEGSSAVTLDLGTGGVCQRDQNLTNSHLQQLTLKLV